MHAASAFHHYLLALGSNLGDREQNLAEALKALATHGIVITRAAPLYETAPLGAADQIFLNSAVTVQSQLEPHALLNALLAIEASLGRVRQLRWGNRTLDIDLLLWQSAPELLSQTLLTRDLTIPHPEMLNRDFVLVPAATIAGDWLHPLTKLTLQEECRHRHYQLLKQRPWPDLVSLP